MTWYAAYDKKLMVMVYGNYIVRMLVWLLVRDYGQTNQFTTIGINMSAVLGISLQIDLHLAKLFSS